MDLDHRIAEVTGLPANRVRLGVDAELAVTGRGGPSRSTDRPSPSEPASALSQVPPGVRAAASVSPPQGAAEPPLGDSVSVEPEAGAGIPSLPASPAAEHVVLPVSAASVPSGIPDWNDLALAGSAAPAVPEATTPEEAGPVPDERISAREGPTGESESPPGWADETSTPASSPEEIEKIPANETGSDTPALGTYLNPEFEGGREHLPRPDDLKSLRSRSYVLATRVAQAAGLQHLVQPDREAPAGFSLRELAVEASERETVLWWILAALSGTGDFDAAPKEHTCVYDPAAFAWHFLFRIELAASVDPIQVPVMFAHPYGFLGAYLLADYDELVRTALTARHVGLMDRDQVWRVLLTVGRAVRRTFNLPVTAWRYTGVTRTNLRARDVLAQRVEAVYAAVGIPAPPADVLQGARRGQHAPVIRMDQDRERSGFLEEDGDDK